MTYKFLSLGGEHVRTIGLSDHEPLISEDTLSWNIMMPGSYRRGRYNNGLPKLKPRSTIMIGCD